MGTLRGVRPDGTDPDDRDALWSQRWLLLASVTVIAAGVVLVLVTQGRGWSWGLFVWGCLVGVAGLAVIAAAFALGARRNEVSERLAGRMKHRLIIYAVLLPFFGAVAGSVSAGFEMPVVDWIVTAMTVVSFGLGFAAAFVALRRQRRAQT